MSNKHALCGGRLSSKCFFFFSLLHFLFRHLITVCSFNGSTFSILYQKVIMIFIQQQSNAPKCQKYSFRKSHIGIIMPCWPFPVSLSSVKLQSTMCCCFNNFFCGLDCVMSWNRFLCFVSSLPCGRSNCYDNPVFKQCEQTALCVCVKWRCASVAVGVCVCVMRGVEVRGRRGSLHYLL